MRQPLCISFRFGVHYRRIGLPVVTTSPEFDQVRWSLPRKGQPDRLRSAYLEDHVVGLDCRIQQVRAPIAVQHRRLLPGEVVQRRRLDLFPIEAPTQFDVLVGEAVPVGGWTIIQTRTPPCQPKASSPPPSFEPARKTANWRRSLNSSGSSIRNVLDMATRFCCIDVRAHRQSDRPHSDAWPTGFPRNFIGGRVHRSHARDVGANWQECRCVTMPGLRTCAPSFVHDALRLMIDEHTRACVWEVLDYGVILCFYRLDSALIACDNVA